MQHKQTAQTKQTLLANDWRYARSLPVQLFTAEQTRTIDALAIASGTPGIVLMKRAAKVIFATLQSLQRDQARPIVILCGAGNNAGDGFLAAQYAREATYSVTVVMVGEATKLAGDARMAYEAMLSAGIKPQQWSGWQPHLESKSIVVDAMLGTGLHGALRKTYAEAIRWLNLEAPSSSSTVVAVDIPSGLCADRGVASHDEHGDNTLPCAVFADITLTFIAPKTGLFLGQACDYIGQLACDDLGVSADTRRTTEAPLERIDWQQALCGWPVKHPSAHKYSSQAVVVIGGNEGMGGAAIMAASTALKLGCGLVKLITQFEHSQAALLRQPELLVAGIDDATIDVTKYIDMQTPEKAGVMLLGPGLGRDSWGSRLLEAGLTVARQRNLKLVLDADALNLIAAQPHNMLNSIAGLALVITPHAGEARRLLHALSVCDAVDSALQLRLAQALASHDRLAQAQSLADALQACVVLKGPGTLCVFPKEGASHSAYTQIPNKVCNYGNSILATAGTGDILAGLIAAAMAQNIQLPAAVEAAVTLHAVAADYWRDAYGSHGFTATELVPAACRVLNQLSAQVLPATLSVAK